MNNNKVFLIDVNYVKNHSSIFQNVEEKFIINHILEAQNIHLQGIVGSTMYEDMINQYDTYLTTKSTSGASQESDFISAEYITFREDFCEPLILYYALYESVIDLALRFTNKGINTQSSPENSQTADIAMINMAKGNFKNKAEYYAERMMKELISGSQNHSKYLKYLNWSVDGDPDEIAPTRDNYFNGIYLGTSNCHKYDNVNTPQGPRCI